VLLVRHFMFSKALERRKPLADIAATMKKM
jgi:hypothetical protein